MVRFIHTSDWQLGMTRRYLTPEAQARYDQARYDAVRAIGRLCRERDCRLVVAAGDLFESNLVRPAVVARALEALRDIPVPTVVLPGNHDPLDEASVYRSAAFAAARPPLLRVLGEEESICIADGGLTVEVVGAPWRSKHPTGNPFLATLDSLAPAEPGVLRIGLAHGMADETAFQGESQALLPMDRIRAALAAGALHYVALGDRHSFTRVADRVWYSGTPEPTDFNEVDPGGAALVELDAGGVRVERVAVGGWRFLRREAALTGSGDVGALAAGLAAEPDKDRAVVRLVLSGSLDVAEEARLRGELERFSHLFAGFDVRDDELRLRVGTGAGSLGAAEACGGFVTEAARRLAARAEAGEAAAADALALLCRLLPPEGGGG